MRILLVNTYYYPNMFGGAEYSVKLLAQTLSKSQECAIFSLDASKMGLIKESDRGIAIYRSGSSFFDFKKRFEKKESLLCKIKNRFADLWNPVSLKHFNQVLNDYKPDIVHTNGLRGIGPKVWQIAAIKGIPVVHSLRDYFVLNPTMDLSQNNILIKLWRRYFAYYSQYITVLSAPSQFVLHETLKRNFGLKCAQYQAVPNSIEYNEQEFQQNIQKKMDRNSQKIRFIFAGTLVEFKGIKNLIETFSSIHDPNIELVICGSGPLKEYIESAVLQDSRIEYKGKLSNQALTEEFLNSDVCVIPSLWEEPFGRVIIEAAYCGCALIASNRGGIPEIINFLKSGILIDPLQKDNLMDAIKRFSHRSFVHQTIETFIEQVKIFSLDKQEILFINIYNEILSMKKRLNNIEIKK